MTPEFIETLSKKSAYKYYNTSHYDDLVSEGILAAYEELGKNPQAPEQRIYQVISTAQWKFLNADCLPVTMPFDLVRVAKGLGSPEDMRGYTDELVAWAKVILSQGQSQADYHGTDHTSNQEEELSKEDLIDKIWQAAQECLTEEEYGLFYAHFEVGLDGKSLGDMTGVSKQAMNKKLKGINQKVRKYVVNKKWEL